MMRANQADLPALFRHTILGAQRNGSRHLAERLRPYQLTPAWAEALSVLQSHGPMTIKALGKQLICESDHPSRLVSRMEGAGLVTRRVNDADKRAASIALTAIGTERARIVEEIEADLDAFLSRRLSSDQMNTVVNVLLNTVRNPDLEQALATRYGLETHDSHQTPDS